MKKNKRPKIGLALGSGGARGFALIGVLKVLEENKIPIDYIAGCSIGAMMGGFYASGLSVPQIEKVAQETDWKFLFSLTDPGFGWGLIRGDKIKDFIKKQVNKIKMEDCPTPFAAVTTDLKSGEMILLDKGDLATAIRASVSIPLIFKPVKKAGRFLVDGCLSLPVPVSIVKKMGADIIIAVNIDTHYSNHKKNLGIHDLLDNSVNILHHHLAAQTAKDADIIIEPNTKGTYWYSWSKFVHSKSLIAAGEKAATEAIPRIKRLIAKNSK